MVVSAALSLALSGCIKHWLFERLPQPTVPDEPAVVTGLGPARAALCAACHTEIGAEWAGSQMAHAWTDPVFQGDFAANNELYACLYCHTPLYEQQPERIDGIGQLSPITGRGSPNPSFNAEFRAEGVTCAACHVREGSVHGPHDITDPAPHPITAVPDFASEARCEPCHQLAAPPLSRLDRPIADTHQEWARWKAQTGRSETCADCHMPAVTRPLVAGGIPRLGKQHLFIGAWDDAFMRSSLGLRLGARGTVTLTNFAGHNLPTAEPGRAVEVTVEALANGVIVATDTLWIERVVKQPNLVDLGDTTLLPAESRSWTPHLVAREPPDTVQARVVFHRLRNLPELIPLAPAPDQVVLIEARGPW